jgi:hypothetical protein
MTRVTCLQRELNIPLLRAHGIPALEESAVDPERQIRAGVPESAADVDTHNVVF